MSLLEVNNLSVSYRVKGQSLLAVKDVTLELKPNECLCLVGESGSGKSTIAKAILRILDVNAMVEHGEVLLDGTNLLKLSYQRMRSIWSRELSIIQQDPLSSLDPSYTIFWQVRELLREHLGKMENEGAMVENILQSAGIPKSENIAHKYPFELSGGLQQRVLIAMASALKPKVIIADEPTSALDVKTQAEIILLLKKLAKANNSAILLITHDLGVVAEMADRVIALYGGQIVEEQEAMSFFRQPNHPYTRALLASRPHNFDQKKKRFQASSSLTVSKAQKDNCCVFAERCPHCKEPCLTQNIPLRVTAEGRTRCLYDWSVHHE